VTSKKPSSRSGGINISGGKVSIGGDIVGRDKIVHANSAEFIHQQFAQIYNQIAALPDGVPDKSPEVLKAVKVIEGEVKKGEAAKPSIIRRQLQFLAGMSDDILDVVAATLTNPLAGLTKTIQLIAKKAREGKQNG
jgi:hypothetical protein